MRRHLPLLAPLAPLAPLALLAAACGDVAGPVRPPSAPTLAGGIDPSAYASPALGYVQTGADGSIPVPAVATELYSLRSSRTDADGFFAIDPLKVGTAQVAVSNLPDGCAIPDAQLVQISRVVEEWKVLRFQVACTATLSGSVRVVTGELLPSHLVLLTVADQPAYPAKDGTFAISGVPVGALQLEVRSDLPNVGCPDRPKLTVPFTAATVELTVDCRLAMSPQVLDGGTPIVGATVSVPGQVGTTTSGSLPILDAVPLGPQTFTVAAVGCTTTAFSRKVLLADFDTRYVFGLPCFGAVKGVLADTKGKAIGGAIVAIGGVQAVTDASGAFALPQVPTGKYAVELSALPKGCVASPASVQVARATTSSLALSATCS